MTSKFEKFVNESTVPASLTLRKNGEVNQTTLLPEGENNDRVAALTRQAKDGQGFFVAHQSLFAGSAKRLTGVVTQPLAHLGHAGVDIVDMVKKLGNKEFKEAGKALVEFLKDVLMMPGSMVREGAAFVTQFLATLFDKVVKMFPKKPDAEPALEAQPLEMKA